MRNRTQLILIFSLTACVALAGCEKLQEGFDYNASFYQNNLNQSVMDFMKSRQDIFSGMLSAIEYVDQDPNFKDVKEMYSTNGNTFLLLHNNALTNLEDGNAYWVLNKILGPHPTNPNKDTLQRGSDWSQYSRDTIATLLRYHVIKGEHSYHTLNSSGKWVETFAYSESNDSAKILMHLQLVREANLRLNNYLNPGPPTNYKGTTVNLADISPRTPDLRATNGIVHVMNRWLIQPTRIAIRDAVPKQ